MKFKIHPLFWALAFALTATGQALDLVWTLFALALHEFAHACVARARGFIIKRLVLLPYGAMMSADENFDRASSVMIGLAGPLANILLALMILGLWWLFPAAYPLTAGLLRANLALGLFNLLPVYPLDGARVALGFCKNRLKAIKYLQIAGTAASVVFFLLFLLSIFFGLNMTLGVIAIFLFVGSSLGTKGETFSSVLGAVQKAYSLGVEKKVVKISASAPIVRLFHHVGSKFLTTFEILSDDGVVTLSEEELKSVALKCKLSTPIGKALGLPYTLKDEEIDYNGERSPKKVFILGDIKRKISGFSKKNFPFAGNIKGDLMMILRARGARARSFVRRKN